MRYVLTLASLILLSACTTQEVGQAVYDSAKTEECRKQGINHCDPYNQSSLKDDDQLIGSPNGDTNEALEKQADKIRQSH